MPLEREQTTDAPLGRPLAAPARTPRRVRDGAGRAIVAALTERLPYKAAALFFSLVLWFVVSVEESTEEEVPVRLAASVDSAIGLVGPAPAMSAVVKGRARDLMKIGGGPLVVRRVFTAETPESLLVEVRPTDVDLPAGSGEAVVRDLQPRAFTLRFAPSPREASRRRAAAAEAASDSASRRARAAIAAANAAAAARVPDWPDRSAADPPRAAVTRADSAGAVGRDSGAGRVAPPRDSARPSAP